MIVCEGPSYLALPVWARGGQAPLRAQTSLPTGPVRGYPGLCRRPPSGPSGGQSASSILVGVSAGTDAVYYAAAGRIGCAPAARLRGNAAFARHVRCCCRRRAGGVRGHLAPSGGAGGCGIQGCRHVAGRRLDGHAIFLPAPTPRRPWAPQEQPVAQRRRAVLGGATSPPGS